MLGVGEVPSVDFRPLFPLPPLLVKPPVSASAESVDHARDLVLNLSALVLNFLDLHFERGLLLLLPLLFGLGLAVAYLQKFVLLLQVGDELVLSRDDCSVLAKHQLSIPELLLKLISLVCLDFLQQGDLLIQILNFGVFCDTQITELFNLVF